MTTMEDLAAALQQLQQQVLTTQADNQVLRERLATFEAQAALSPSHGAGMSPEAREVVAALRGLPEGVGKLAKPKGLIDPRGLGKPQILGENAGEKFRLWAIKLEDYVSGVFGGKSREVLEWAASMDTEITPAEIEAGYGSSADILDQWDEVHEFNEQLYTVLRATTEGNPFDLVENCATGAGRLEEPAPPV